MSRALHALVKVRGIALDAAKRDLATAIGREATTLGDAQAIERTIAAESAIAQASVQMDEQRAFSAWLSRARQQKGHARQLHKDAAAATALFRAGLADAHAGLQIAEELLQRVVDARKARQAQDLQRTLDEVSLRKPVHFGPDPRAELGSFPGSHPPVPRA